ncbi:hypothetical protein AVEN_103382-1 [Araneus ventricosus]|uniref:Uncharacterized protein n=1 Tax=Araneus ventricosus TaxID=182803 RepID=A0A4Y2PJA7_ARAVE|nr:hypothetical protein AVEN_103382-1 [Araneus ventricosus]
MMCTDVIVFWNSGKTVSRKRSVLPLTVDTLFWTSAISTFISNFCTTGAGKCPAAPPTTEPKNGRQPPALGIPSLGASRNLYAQGHPGYSDHP